MEDSVKRIKELEVLIKKYQDSYYNGEGEISDSEFDILWDELRSLDSANPILHRIGVDSGNFEKAMHIMPMGSQEKASTPEEFLEWAKKHDYPEYLVEFKLDGASLELQYSEGHLLRAVTRGDGDVGDVITENAIKMQGVVESLSSPFTGGIRGEVIMKHSVHERLYADKANCRNAANGIMKRKDGEGSENLSLIVYDVWASSGDQPFKDEQEKLLFLSQNGFDIVRLKICQSAQEVIEYREKVMEERQFLEFDIDGLVVKEREVNHEDALRDRPDRQIAFKFSLEEAISIIRKVEWNESGATYTPIALFDPVPLNGTKVKRASLVNPKLIRSLGVQIGSRVVVVKRGEIIPKIVDVLPGGENLKPVEFPKKCSFCGSALIDDDTRLFCPNTGCEKRILHRLLKWVSVLDIRDLGDTLVKSLFQSQKVRKISDFYSLSVQDLSPYFLNQESMEKEKKSLGAEKVFSSIQSRRKISLAKFIAGFDIEGIGETVVESLIAGGINTLKKILDATEEQVASVYGFAEITAKTLIEGINENKNEIESLVSSGTITVIEGDEKGSLSGKSFCFTGELSSMKRSDAQSLVKEKGGAVKSSVVKGLSYLVTNDPESGSSKNKKARELGTKVISEKDFLALLEN